MVFADLRFLPVVQSRRQGSVLRLLSIEDVMRWLATSTGRLVGKQSPRVNDGSAVGQETVIPAFDGLFLRRR